MHLFDGKQIPIYHVQKKKKIKVFLLICACNFTILRITKSRKLECNVLKTTIALQVCNLNPLDIHDQKPPGQTLSQHSCWDKDTKPCFFLKLTKQNQRVAVCKYTYLSIQNYKNMPIWNAKFEK